MALGYRNWAGVTVASDCEAALNYYRLVANRGELSILLFQDQKYLLVVSEITFNSTCMTWGY